MTKVWHWGVIFAKAEWTTSTCATIFIDFDTVAFSWKSGHFKWRRNWEDWVFLTNQKPHYDIKQNYFERNTESLLFRQKTFHRVSYRELTNATGKLCPFNRKRTKLLILHQLIVDTKTHLVKFIVILLRLTIHKFFFSKSLFTNLL